MQSLRRVLGSFRFAIAGIRYLLLTQPNFRVHCLAAAVVLAAIVIFRVTPVETAVLTLAIGLVLACEAGNTAIEATVDIASPDHHPLAKVAKDAGAASVLLAAITAASVGLVILGPRVLALLAG